MKYIIFFSLLILTFSSQAAPTCSRNGTTVIYTNGVTTARDDADIALGKIMGLGLNSQIDLKTVNYDVAYNYAEGVAKDFIEVAVQRFPQRFLNELGTKDPYAAYGAYLNGKLSGAAYSNELNAISDAVLNALDSYIRDYANFSQYTQSVESIKSYYEAALNKGERVFAISHSQGGLFMRDAYDALDVPAKNRFFSGFQIASPLNGEMNSHFGYATHDKDRLINALRSLFGALPHNVTAPLFVRNGFEGIGDYVLDFIINHGITTTYLYDSEIKSQVISKLIETAELLESNCVKAIIDYTKNDLQVNFDSTNPNRPDATGLTYFWNFDDGQKLKTTEKKISHNYLFPGTYTVTLKAVDPFGFFDVIKVTFQVGPCSVHKKTSSLSTVFQSVSFS